MAPPRRPSFARSVVFALLPLVSLWLGLEALALVWFLWGPSSKAPRPKMMYAPHPYRVYHLVPGTTDERGTAHHNRFGLRGRDFPARKPPATIRIVCLGGSTTYCSAATTDSHTYPGRLEQFLRRRYAGAPFKIEVINAGHSAYTSLESLVLFETRMLDFSPDVAIFHNAVNDLWEATQFRGFASDYSIERRTFGPMRAKVWEYSPLLTILFRRATTPFNPYAPNKMVGLMSMIHHPINPLPNDRAVWAERARLSADVLERNIRSFIAVARGNGVIPVLSTMSCGSKGSLFYEGIRVCNERIRRLAAAESVVLVDFASSMPWNSRIFYDDCHIRDRPEGLERKGRIFADVLIREGIIEKAARRRGLGPEARSPR